MTRNPKKAILEDLQTLRNYMYNLNSSHILELQPPPELNDVEKQKWMQRQARYRQPKKNNMSKDWVTMCQSTDAGTSEQKSVEQQNEFLGFYNKNLGSVRQDSTKRKSTTSDLPTNQNKKIKG